MVAELGQTNNPQDLIPGNPSAIANDLRDLAGNLGRMNSVHSGLAGVNPGQWTGPAAEAFHSVFSAEPQNWADAVNTAVGGGNALSDYHTALVWAQGQAQQAIEMYAKAQAASRTAAAQYNAAAQTAATAGQTMPPFNDPGTAGAQAAQKLLAAARGALGQVGDAVASSLGFKKNANANGTFSLELGDIDGSKGKDDSGSFGSQSGELMSTGIDNLLNKLGINTTITSGSISGSAQWLHGSTDGKFGAEDGFNGSGKADGSLLGADGQASGTLSWLQASGSVSGEAYLAKGEASGQVDYGNLVGAKGDVQGMVGADGKLSGTVGVTGVQVSGEAFAGAKASGEADADVAGVGVGVNGQAWAGVGVDASGQFGMGSDGKFHVGASLGAALGVGGKLGFDISIDPHQVESTVSTVAGDLGHAAHSAGHDIVSAGGDVLHSLGL